MKLQKWGNSAAVRLPKEWLNQLDWHIGDTLSHEIGNGQIVLKNTKRPRYRLDDLLEEVHAPRVAGWEEMDEVGKEQVE